jgi:uncharacterized RDD family membrane protein YckC
MAVSTAVATATPTRTGPKVRIRYASFEARAAAVLLDLLVFVILTALLVIAGSLVVLVSSDFERVDPSTTSINTFWGCVGGVAPVLLLYLFISYAWKGQTVGMAVMQLMVIRSDGRPLGVLGSMARVIGLLTYVLFLVVGAGTAFLFRDNRPLALGAIGGAALVVLLAFLMAAFDPRRRTLHDRMAGTIVVRLL